MRASWRISSRGGSPPAAERRSVGRREVSPTLLLAIAAALFVAPAAYLLAVSMASQQGSLGGATLSGTAETAIWAAGGASLLAPFAIRRFLRSSERATRLLLILVLTVSASVFGCVLSFATGRVAPVRVLGVGSMLGILSWSGVYRECFRADPLERIVSRYTTVLIVFGAISLAFAAFRAALWDYAATPSGGSASSGFMIFIDTTVGVAALSTARLRKLGSAYAQSATRVLSWALLPIPLLGSLTSLYWIFAVRKRERSPSVAHAAQQADEADVE